ncbi:hypothetical protein TNCV_3337291 [Trichonephila clavipes]|nr:hypothetical protein TNCV_3337291 [Trichonephila clavipes]
MVLFWNQEERLISIWNEGLIALRYECLQFENDTNLFDRKVSEGILTSHSSATRGLLVTNLVILNHVQVTHLSWQSPLQATILTGGRLSFDRFNVHRSLHERSVRAVDEAGVVVQRYPMHAQLETYLVISQAKVTSQHSVLHTSCYNVVLASVILLENSHLDAAQEGRCQGNYSQFGLAIHQNDHQARRRFVEWAQNEIAVVPDFHKRILFSDEAHFWLNGYVNKQNCRIWSEANPQVYVETPLHPEKLTVWCALWAGGILLQK